jgi:hypothetical protein
MKANLKRIEIPKDIKKAKKDDMDYLVKIRKITKQLEALFKENNIDYQKKGKEKLF